VGYGGYAFRERSTESTSEKTLNSSRDKEKVNAISLSLGRMSKNNLHEQVVVYVFIGMHGD
jgi:hypothetical protein